MYYKKKSTVGIYFSISRAVALTFCIIFILKIYLKYATVKYVIIRNHTYTTIIVPNITRNKRKQTCRTICENIDSVPLNKVNTLKPIGKMTFNDNFDEHINPINDTFYPHNPGGSWMFKEENTTCSNVPLSGVAIVIVCRDRWKQLNNTLSNLIPVLQRQHLCYRIFVIEQEGNDMLNKGQLLNIGFVEASKRFRFNCVIFHDADVIPLDDRIPHDCDNETLEHVVHLSVGVSTWNYILPYKSLIGGVLKISTKHLMQINGYSNGYFGWGGEDDDLEKRLKASKIMYKHIQPSIGRYFAQPHAKQVRSKVKIRYRLLRSAASRIFLDGLNSLKYEIRNFSEKQYYTHILIALK
ncbi:unnamed protein product [Schistosoma turkestanicum]|nr:unnamed protein product [Schistosoma turkestanicum]